MRLVTHQTGPEGIKSVNGCHRRSANIQKELYIGMVVDRGSQRSC
jgi:succinyl-CoA synthetase beta subunit